MISCTFEDGGLAKPGLRHAVIDTIVLKDNKILLVKRTKKLSEGGKWALVGGFVSRDEDLKHAVEREVLEETGYKIENITLLSIVDNPNRSHEDRQNISCVFFCDALNKEGESDWETDEIKWFELNNLPNQELIAFDHFKDIELFLQYKKEEFKIPVFGYTQF